MGSHMDWNWHLWTRAEGDSCRSNEGAGTCIHNSTCIGVSYPDEPLCPFDPAEIQCCFVRICEVPQGKGYCRSAKNNGCPDGQFFPGTSEPWPCPGGNDIQCCVKSADMTTATSTDTTSPTTTDGTATATTTLSPDEGNSLEGGHIAGIVVGVVAVVALIIAGAAWIYFRRRRARRSGPDAVEAPDNEKVELPSQQDKTQIELPDTGPAFGVPRNDNADEKKEIIASRDNKISPVELPSPATNPPPIQKPPVELDASESPTRPHKTD